MIVPASYYRNLQCPHQHAPWSMPPRNEQFLLLPHTVQTQGEISKECLLLSGSSSNKSSLKSILSLCTLPVIATSILKPQTSFSELGRLETQGAGRSPYTPSVRMLGVSRVLPRTPGPLVQSRGVGKAHARKLSSCASPRDCSVD